MFDSISGIFRSSEREAKSHLARIMARFSLVRVPYEHGLEDDNRDVRTLYTAMGVWLYPTPKSGKAQDIDLSRGVPAVTQDLRGGGLGIMTPVPFDHDTFVVAIQDDEERWRFLQCCTRHNTRGRGGWYHLGAEATGVMKLTLEQLERFLKHSERVFEVTEKATKE